MVSTVLVRVWSKLARSQVVLRSKGARLLEIAS